MTGLRSINDSTSKRVLNLLKTGQYRLRESIVMRIVVINFGVNNRGSICMI